MTSGAFAAACVFGFRIWYVDSKYQLYPPRPEDGTEFYRSIFSPMKIFSQQDRDRACKLFDTCHYEAAYGVLKGALDNFENPDVRPYIEESEDLRRNVESLAVWAECYMHWDNMRYLEAKAALDGTGFARSDDLHYRFISILAQMRNVQSTIEKRLEEQKENIDMRKLGEETIKVMFDRDAESGRCREFAFHFALDMYLSALRRVEQGNYDDAIIRMARTVDICTQYSVYEERKEVVRWQLGQKLEYLKETSENSIYRDPEINQLVYLRNSLCPIHHISTADTDEIDRFRPAVRELLETFGLHCWKCAGVADSFDEFLSNMKFHDSREILEAQTVS
jgi:hypothetical protein